MLRVLALMVGLLPSVAFSAPLCWESGGYGEDDTTVTASAVEADEYTCEFMSPPSFDGSAVAMICTSVAEDDPPWRETTTLHRIGNLLYVDGDPEPWKPCVTH